MNDRITGSAHPSVDKLRTFGLGQLEEVEAAVIEEHVSHCEPCCRTLASIGPDTLVDLLRSARRFSLAEDATIPPTEGRASGLALPFAAGDRTAAEAPGDPEMPYLPPELLQHPRYRVLSLLGTGGMGSVYKAEHLLMERRVAIKVMAPALLASAASVERFRREVKTAAQLAHANIVTAHDAEQAGGVHFLVMEYVEGIDLARWLAAHGPLPAAEACDCVCQAAAGLQHAHEHGMIHRDIKPHNLMRTCDGTIKVLDFGLARLAAEAGAVASNVTGQGTLLGTVDYLAPEQADDARQADIRSDIYSLGCTLYHLLSGRPPFPQGTLVQKIMAHTERQATPLGDLRPDLPPGLLRVVERMMAKLPSKRYQTPAEVRAALEPFAEASGGRTERIPARKRRPPRKEDILDPLPVRSRLRRRRPLALGLLALLLGGLIAAGIAVYRIQTDNGELVISTDNADVEVVIKQNGKLVRIIDTKTGKEVKLDSGRYELELKGRAEGLKLSPDKFTLRRGETVVATVERRPIKKLDEKVGEVRCFLGHQATVHSVAFSPDGKLVASGSGGLYLGAGRWAVAPDYAVRLWDVATGREIRQFQGHESSVTAVAFSPDGTLLATAGSHDKSVRVWEVTTAKELLCLTGHDARTDRVAFLPGGKQIVSAGFDGSLRLWDVKSGKEVRQFTGHEAAVNSVAVSPDGRRLASGSSDKTVRLWEVETGKELRQFAGHTGRAESVAFSPNGRLLLSADLDAHVARLWDVESGKELRSFVGHTDAVLLVAFTPDGRRALSSSHDATLRLWDVATGKELHRIRSPSSTTGLAVSADGRYVLSGGADKSVRLWRLPAPPPGK